MVRGGQSRVKGEIGGFAALVGGSIRFYLYETITFYLILHSDTALVRFK